MAVYEAYDSFDSRRRATTESLACGLISAVHTSIGATNVVSFWLDGTIISLGVKESAIFGDDFKCVVDNESGDAFVEGNLMAAYQWFDRCDDEAPMALRIAG